MSLVLIAFSFIVSAIAAQPAPTFDSLKAAFQKADVAFAKDYPKVTDLYAPGTTFKCVGVGRGTIKGVPGAVYNMYIGSFDYLEQDSKGTVLGITTTLSMSMMAQSYPPPRITNADVVTAIRSSRLTMPEIQIDPGTGETQTITKGLDPSFNDYLNVVTYRKKGKDLHFHEAAKSPKNKWDSEFYGHCFTP